MGTRIIHWGKIVFITNGAGTTGDPQKNKGKLPISHHIENLTQNWIKT